MSNANYVSPIDGHEHHDFALRDYCAVCELEDERDRLQALVERQRKHMNWWRTMYRTARRRTATGEVVRLRAALNNAGEIVVRDLPRLEAERDQLLERVELLEDDLAHVALLLAGTAEPAVNTTAAEDAYDMVRALVADRDRLREALKMIAMPPLHVPEVSEGCEGCAAIAKAALDGVDVAGPISTTLAEWDAQQAVVRAARQWYQAEDVDVEHAAAGLKEAMRELTDKEGT